MVRRPTIAPVMFVGIASLLAALWAGLVRMGWPWPLPVESWPAVHGVLMVNGFLGTLVSLERAVGFRRRWGFGAPILTALGTLLLLTGRIAAPAPLFFLLGSAAFAVLALGIVRVQAAAFTLIMMGGALSWFVGNSLWFAGWPVHRVLPWWIGFLTLTIAGERLELSRVLVLPRAATLLLSGAAALLVAAMAVSTRSPTAGEKAFGLGLLSVALWLLRFDVARRTVRQSGQTRYIALSLLSGYLWLAAGALLFLAYGGSAAGPYYDGALHAVFVGFVFSMIFGHALIIFPALLGVRLPYGPLFYLPLAVLHLSLVVRVGGDLFLAGDVRRWGGLLNGLAIVSFLAVLVRTAVRGRRAPPS